MLAVFFLAGCVAETVRKSPPRKSPIKEVGYIDMGGGEVRYSEEGWSWFVAGRRRAAVHLMRHVCGKLKPVVTEEFIKEDADVPYAQSDIQESMQRGAEHFIVAPYTHMIYDCAWTSTGPVTSSQSLRPAEPLVRPVMPPIETVAPVISSATAPAATVSSAAAIAEAPVSSAPAAVALSSASATPAAAPAPRPLPAAAWSPFSWFPPAPANVNPSSATPSPAPPAANTAPVKQP